MIQLPRSARFKPKSDPETHTGDPIITTAGPYAAMRLSIYCTNKLFCMIEIVPMKSQIGNQEMYNTKFRKGWYITGDQARQDQDGYFWFVGRADDVINTAGHLVGPFEVESCSSNIRP